MDEIESSHEKPFLIITGMHRSGTSFLARSLNLRGTFLGTLNDINSNEWTPLPDNLKGHWENDKFVKLADQTLSSNDGSWDNIPDKIKINDEISTKIKSLSNELQKNQLFASGFKDPRAVVCLESWTDFLPENYLIIGIFRHPLKVAESLKNRNNFSYEKSILLWKIYNEQLLKNLENHDGFLLNFDSPKDELLSEIDLISEKLGLMSITLSDWFDEKLQHSDKTFQTEHTLSPEIESLYSKLVEKSKENKNSTIQFSISNKNNEKITNKLLSDIKLQGDYFKKINEKNNEKIKSQESSIDKLNSSLKSSILQVEELQRINLENQPLMEKLQHQINKLETKNNELDFHIKELQLRNTELQSYLKSSQEQIKEYHQSFVFQMLRKYDNSLGKIIPLRPKKYLKSSKEEIPQNIQKENIHFALTDVKLEKKDILCFPIINWDYRIQRSQHILRKFAQNNHRIFYLKASLRELKKPYQIKKLEKNIYELELNTNTFFDIYKDVFDEKISNEFLESFKKFHHELKVDPISFIAFPTWIDPVLKLREIYDSKIIFDCLDDFSSFSNVNKIRDEEEKTLFEKSDLVITTSQFLLKKATEYSKNTINVTNAGEFSHFSKIFTDKVLSKYKKPIIGYFGAIAEWFDTDLIEFLAKQRPKYTFILIGHTFGANISKLEKFPNVHFLGELPYSELPLYLHEFDACLIPFKMTSLIEATHPVKIYEYFAAGKPVVSSNLTELKPFEELCYIAHDQKDFLSKLDIAINEKNAVLSQKRINFSSKNTWNDRFESIYSHLKENDSFDILNHKYSKSSVENKV